MRAMLLAAGIGSRLRPITKTVPKCLVTIHERPLLDYWLDTIFCSGVVDRVLINTHHLAHQVLIYVAQSVWRERIDLVHEAELLGTGGTLKANRSYFGDESFLLAHADNLTDFDLAALVDVHGTRPGHCAMTMLTFRTDDPHSCGIVELDEYSVVQAFHEKVANPPSNLANAAVYILTPEVADQVCRLPDSIIDMSKDVIPTLMGRIFAVETSRYHRDIGTPERLDLARREFQQISGCRPSAPNPPSRPRHLRSSRL